ncbi:MAG: ABC transporter permease subunit [Planctomycetaceae bacterium]|nr:ABC transporter permease subunit [Planctomycetaceae bacterium]
MLSPIFTIEAITTARRSRYFWVRCVYALFLLFMLIMTYVSHQQSRMFANQGVANLARDFFNLFTGVQLTAIMLLTPALTAGTIAGELERKTLDYLLVSPLSSASILWGKLGARLLLAGLLIAGGVPVLAAAMLLGGIPPLNLLTTAVVSLATLLVVGALSLGVSVWAVRTRDAILSSYILLIALHVFPLMGSTMRGWHNGPLWNLLAEPLADISELALHFTPYGAAYTPSLTHFLVAIGVQLTFAGLIVAYAAWRLRSLAARRTGDEARRKRWLGPRLQYRPRLRHDAMLWKEMFVEKTALRWGCLVRAALVGILGCILASAVSTFLNAIAYGTNQIEGLYFIYGLVGTLTLLIATARGATLITNERERDTWLTLTSTPLTAREIVRAKVRGNLYAMRWPVGLMLLLLAMACVLKPELVLIVPLCLLDLAVLLTFCSAWGVQCSLTFASSTAAMWSAVGTVVLIGGGYWMCCGTMFAFVAINGNSQAAESLLMIALAPCMPFLLSFPAFLPEMHRNGSEAFAVFFAWVLGTIGYSVAAGLVYLGAINEFDTRAGRISESDQAVGRASRAP